MSEYPSTYQNANLLGIDGDGLAEYLRVTGEVFLMELDEQGGLQVPEGVGPSYEISLPAFGWSLAEYLLVSSVERGKWKALAEPAVAALAEEMPEHSSIDRETRTGNRTNIDDVY